MNMKFAKKILSILVVTSTFLLNAPHAFAAVPSVLTLSAVAGDAVHLQITGTPSSNVQLSFLAQGASNLTTISFGTTDTNGNFSTTISSGGYGIPQGSPVYITIGGTQSTTALWPNYTSVLTLSQTNVQLAIGQNTAISGSSALVLASNSAPSVVATAINGSQITVTGLANGTGTVTVCGVNLGCGSIVATIGGTGQTQITFSENNFSINALATKNVSIFGGSVNGYTIKSNSNSTSVQANVSGTSNILSIFGNTASGSATITVCSVENSSNCASLIVTVIGSTSSMLSFSQNNLNLIPGLSQSVYVSGGPDSNYFVSSNSNSGVALATASGNTISVTGGSNAGTTAITVCSASVNATCGTLSVSLTLNQNTASVNTITFSQNVVTVSQGNTTNVTVSGGNGTGYLISSNSNPLAVTPMILGSSNVISLYGANTGSTIISVCSASSGSVCANMYVTVGSLSAPITFSQTNPNLNAGGSVLITVTGGNGGSKTITGTSNANVASATLNSSGNVLVVNAGNYNGSSVITICSTTDVNNCASLTVTVGGASDNQNPVTTVTPSSPTGPNYDPDAAKSAAPSIGSDHGIAATTGAAACTADSLIRASSKTVYYCGADGKRYVFPNAKTYATWYADFSSVKILSDAVLASIPLGGNVTYRPGVRLVKITTDVKVYAVAPGGTLRWITTGDLATKYYGANWSKLVDDVPDAYFTNYRIGADITQ